MATKLTETRLKAIAKEIVAEAKKRGNSVFYFFDDEDLSNLSREKGYEEFIKMNECIINYIEGMRGVGKVTKMESTLGTNDRGRLVYGTYAVEVLSNPCKEFAQLANWLKKYANYELKMDSVRENSISGKRSNFSVNYSKFLAHKPTKCKEYLEILRKHRSTNDKLTCSIHEDMYYGDRYNSYGEDRECEWSGCQSNYLMVEIFTPTNRKKNEINLTAY